MNTKETKKNIILAGQIAVEELIKVAKEPIVDSGAVSYTHLTLPTNREV